MKKLFTLLVVTLLTGVGVAFADNDKAIDFNQLPEKAQKFIKTHFPNYEISYAKEDADFFYSEYEVMLVNGTKLEFTSSGDWKDVESRVGEVPAAIVPKQIKEYVGKKYPDAKILKIDRENANYDIELSNRLELTFDKKYRLIDIDD